MVVRNKVYTAVAKFHKLLKSKQKKSLYPGMTIKGYRSKTRVLNFYTKHGRWPSRKGSTKTERQLGTRFENYVSKTSPSYDSHFRRLAMATGLRTTNGKRPHDVSGFKQEIMDFIAKHGRVPTTNSGETIEGEGRLRSKLDYYTKVANDMTLLGKVYATDKCHRSGIPAKYRAIINEALDVNKPLLRLV